MSRHGTIVSELPHDLYPIDRWSIVETKFAPQLTSLLESVFALGNGWVGVRGSFHQGRPAHQPGVLLNGFYEAWPIVYPESAFGYATAGQTIVYVPDPTTTKVAVGGESADFEAIDIRRWERRLDFKTGTLSHEYSWTTASGVGVDVEAIRLVSLADPDLVACRLTVAVDRAVEVELSSVLINRQDTDYLHPAASEFDPRRAKNFGRRVLEPTGIRFTDHGVSVGYETVQSRLHLGVTMEQAIDRPAKVEAVEHPDHPRLNYHIDLGAGDTATLDTFTVYRVGSDRGIDFTEDACEAARTAGFESVRSAHAAAWSRFWDRADIHVGTDQAVQQAVRWILFQLNGASANIRKTGIAAKGVTGQAYEGHYFWDTEIFVLPFLVYTNPSVAAELIRFRHRMLDEARQRAGELSLRGALFPWRTINGHEASAYYAAGTAQYHINADIAYALRKYVEVTGDEELLWDVGVEILVETARMWADLGFHRDGAFHIYGVTGPDEYTAIVDDNAYTNLMAQMNLRVAVDSVRAMAAQRGEAWLDLSVRLGVSEAEIAEWAAAADQMYVPFDEGYAITKQDESFMAKERWDFESVPPDKYPLLLHFHPLVIYRYQVLKQADVVLANFLLGDQFSSEDKRSNFEYYDPLTTGDSSLSACVQSIVASEIGKTDIAMDYFRSALFTDLADLHGNTTDGVHLASAGGVWMALIYGMAGMRDYQGRIGFDPRLPPEWRALVFSLQVRGATLGVDLDHDRIALTVDDGEIEVSVRGESFVVGTTPIEVRLE